MMSIYCIYYNYVHVQAIITRRSFLSRTPRYEANLDPDITRYVNNCVKTMHITFRSVDLIENSFKLPWLLSS